jgi:hypothetical protein|tara:strand:+ start:2538 stop:2798 length:261 start_codon:yes stop_codon:yes gene_type:complete
MVMTTSAAAQLAKAYRPDKEKSAGKGVDEELEAYEEFIVKELNKKDKPKKRKKNGKPDTTVVARYDVGVAPSRFARQTSGVPVPLK